MDPGGSVAEGATGRLFTKRHWLGALLFLIFVGEPTVGLRTGLFLPPGLFVLGGLYLTLFWLFEALVDRFDLTYARLVPLTFALYSVLVTGLLHAELADYAKGRVVITTLIRIQCSLFPIFAYYLLNRFRPRQPGSAPSVMKAGLIIALFFLLLTPSHKFGYLNLIDTIRDAPVLSLGFIAAGLVALGFALRPVRQTDRFESRSFTIVTWSLLVIACTPLLVTLLILLLAMPIVVAVYWRYPTFRHAKA